MKRMSEVFELPISGSELKRAMVESDFCTEQDYAAHAVSHADALADALGDIVFDYFATINLSNVDMATLNPELHKKMTVATGALAAYRGYK